MEKQESTVDQSEATAEGAASIGFGKLALTGWLLKGIKERSGLTFLVILLVGLGSFVKFVAVPGAAGKLFEIAAKDHQLDIEVEDWSVGLMSGTVTAKNVRWLARGNKLTHKELFQADSITASVDRSVFLPFFGSDLVSSINSIKISDPTVFIEHKNGGRWNWESAMSARKLNRQLRDIRKAVNDGKNSDDAAELAKFNIHSIEATDLKVVWTEELQANSGNGRIQKLTSTLNIDDAELLLSDIHGWFQKEEQPIQVDFDGRTADGVIKASGEINPFWLVSNEEATTQQVAWLPAVNGLTIYVENVNTQAFGKMVPDSLFQPVSGKMTGEIAFGLDRGGVSNYDIEMEYDQVKWTVNNRSSLYKAAFRTEEEETEVTTALNDYAKSGLIQTSSKGNVNEKEFQLIPSIQTSMTRKALADSPPIISARAAQDQFRFEDKQLSPMLAELKNISSTLSQINKVANQAGGVARSANTVTRSINSATRTLKNIFK